MFGNYGRVGVVDSWRATALLDTAVYLSVSSSAFWKVVLSLNLVM